MKCINRLLALILIIVVSFSLVACGQSDDSSVATYDLYETSYSYGITNNGSDSDVEFFAQDLCIQGTDDIGTADVDSQVAGAAGAFNTTTQRVTYAQNIHEKMYPASTTKILTAYVACLYGNLDDTYTVSANALDIDKDSSVCGLKEGDVITLRDLLYGLLLRSGNDAANVIAEGVSGDIDSFVSLMNSTAQSVGATNSHFVNANGLHDEDHYTTVYDMYLILNTAITNSDFYSVFTSTSYTANYTSGGGAKTVEWKTTNQYISGNITTPNGFSILGGKTGTTGAAGYCLVLLSENSNHDKIISIVDNADCKHNLYLLMNEILNNYCS